MPKVETSRTHNIIRGVHSNTINLTNSYVSNFIGIKQNASIRLRRYDETSPKRRVVKKLIRVQPVNIQNLELSSSNNNYSKRNRIDEENNNNVSRSKFYRKRVVIKKRPIKQTTPKPRRRIVVTRRRPILVTNNDMEPTFATLWENAATFTKALDGLVMPTQVLPDYDENEALDNTEISTEKLSEISDSIKILPETSTVSLETLHENATIFLETTNTEILLESTETSTGVIESSINNIDSNATSVQIVASTIPLIDDSQNSLNGTLNNTASLEKIDLNDLTTENPITTEDFTTDESPKEIVQNLPDYEPYFPELTESLDAPIILLKTTVLSSVEFELKTITESRLRTYTFVVTRVSGDEQIVTSTTEVKPQIKTTIITEPTTKYRTVTLLDLDATETLPFIPLTVNPSAESSTHFFTDIPVQERGRSFEEARYNLATRIMSNGVEVIVAGDKSTLPGEPDVKRILPSTIYKPVTLKPSTLSDHMLMLLPSNIRNLSSSFYPNQFVTKTCLTTFTYLTTYLENGSTTISSHEQVVSNVATEERNTGKILPTPTMGITLTQHPNLAVGVFLTTYTYLNTILDDDQPLVVTSKHTVTNTVTAPDDYLSLFQPSDVASAIKDTNTYYSTINLEKTLYEGKQSKIISTEEVITQVVITESIPPKATSVMTSYIALDFEDTAKATKPEIMTTDVVKTYFVTYTYYNNVTENGHTIVQKNVSTSTDIITEKIYLNPKRTKHNSNKKSVINTSPIDKKKVKLESKSDNLEIFATKTYLTTFTYLTTLLQENKGEKSTVVSSNSRVIENIVTETIDLNLLDSKQLNSIKNQIKDQSRNVVTVVSLHNGQYLEVTAQPKETIKPTHVLPVEKTKMPDIKITTSEYISPNVIKGSTIIFAEDNDPFAALALSSTPTLTTKATVKNELNLLLSSEIVKNSATSSQKSKTNTKRNANKSTAIAPTSVKLPKSTISNKPPKKKNNKTSKPAQVSDILGLSSINMQALKPVLNAMAGLINTNLKSNKRNETSTSTTTHKPISNVQSEERISSIGPPASDIQNRSPIYIPVGGLADIDVAESQNIASYYPSDQIPWSEEQNKPVVGKHTHESPLLNGGIPISPGEVITANSDVIIGKPGRIGPRVPSIPLHEVIHNENILGIKPPPILNDNWAKPTQQHAPIIHAPNIDDYIGPPPPLHSQPQINEDTKIKANHIPLNYHEASPNLRYQNDVNTKLPDNLHQDAAKLHIGGSIINFNLQPSILSEQIRLPEVIERSTGQPLLVNIQPSQIAIVNIPHNRTTALIYGGSTEPHRNGQYFDDPSPYPQPEFSAIENFNHGVPQFASIYQDSPSQKEVVGVIKVGTQMIDYNSQNSHEIQPSKPVGVNYHRNKQEININVPPISFGMVNQANDFNAHVIKHEDINFDAPPPVSYNIVNQIQNQNQQLPSFVMPGQAVDNSNYVNFGGSINVNIEPSQQISQLYPGVPQFYETSNNAPALLENDLRTKLKRPSNTPPNLKPPNYRRPPRPNRRPTRPKIPVKYTHRYKLKPELNDVVEYMTPPAPPITAPHYAPIPIQSNVNSNAPASMFIQTINEMDDNKDDDLINEDGEVIQESNSRPLRPGQVPIEVLMVRNMSTTSKPVRAENANQQKDFVNFNDYTVSINMPKPFVRPENQQNNQINHKESNTIVQTVNTYPVYNNAFNVQEFSRPTTTTTTTKSTMQETQIHNVYYKTTRPIQNYRTTTKRPTTEKIVQNFIRKPAITNQRRTNYKQQMVYNNHTTTPVASTPKIYLRTTTETIKNFFTHRPRVTSLPIDSPNSISQKNPIYQHFNDTQTEKPFKSEVFTKLPPDQNLSGSTNSIRILGQKESKRTSSTTKTPHETTTKMNLNIGEVSKEDIKMNQSNNDMEIMKPPPIIMKHPVRKPDVIMHPPKVEGISNIYRHTTKKSTLEGSVNTQKPFVPPPSEEMLPPPKKNNEEVVGLNPPPRITTYRPLINITTQKPVYSLEIDTPRTSLYTIITTEATTRKPTRRRRPFTRRPFITTTKLNYNNKKPTLNGNLTHGVVKYERPTILIQPSPTVKMPSTAQNKEEDVIVLLAGSENTRPTRIRVQYETTSNSPKVTNTPTFISGLHHSGNEIRIVDDTTIPEKQSPVIKAVPTRFITHTKTSTVTITKTTVVKSLGAPPSTMTLLVTKTEKSTLIDTVTEIHTLVRPTSIIETVTTTINQLASSLYPPNVSYGSGYNAIKPTTTHSIPTSTITIENIDDVNEDENDDDLEEFIISETDPPIIETKTGPNYDENESIFVVMTDKKQGSVIKVPNDFENQTAYETENRDEIVNNDVNRVLLGGILIASPPSLETPNIVSAINTSKCHPECKASRNELCQRVESMMRCVCRPGFARMFPDRPCKPTYTYSLKIPLERYGKEMLRFDENLGDSNTTKFTKLAAATHEGLDRMVMQSDLRDIYHGVRVKGYEPHEKGLINQFYLQLSDSADESRLEEVFKKYLRSNNYSLGGTEIYASKENLERLEAEDFDECVNTQFHDCSENAQCFNLRGTYTCSCKEGYADLSENILYPGRICSAELIGCEKCHYHGTCYDKGENQILCECFQWYAGESCHINLKVLLIALVTLGVILFTLLLICIIMTCCRKTTRNSGIANGMSFLPQRVTLDRRAMIQDTSSESSHSETNNTLPYVSKKDQKKPKGALKKSCLVKKDIENVGNVVTYPDQKDRSLTVMIPRAKYHPAPPTSPHLNLTTFDKRKISAASSNETKLLSYLDAGPSPVKPDKQRKVSNITSSDYLEEKLTSRKTSGALISAGFEVSATVVGNGMGSFRTIGNKIHTDLGGNNMGTLATTCGTEADRSENATLIQKISADLLSSADTQSQFNTFRKSLTNVDVENAMVNWLDIPQRVPTVSEARSYDETTIHPPMTTLRNDYDSKPSSQHQNDEANTMAERDLGSTFLLPHTHLYKPDRGSDISGFESL